MMAMWSDDKIINFQILFFKNENIFFSKASFHCGHSKKTWFVKKTETQCKWKNLKNWSILMF